jgi:hypothetical protein
VGAVDLTVGLELIQSEIEFSIMLASEFRKCLDNGLIPTLTEEELWSFVKPDDQYPGNAQDKNKRSTCVEHVSPSHIVVICARDRTISGAAIVCYWYIRKKKHHGKGENKNYP